MLIEEKMQLIKSGAGHLPMRLLVEVAKGDGVGEELVQLFGHFQPHRFFQLQRHGGRHGAKCLKFAGGLGIVGLR